MDIGNKLYDTEFMHAFQSYSVENYFIYYFLLNFCINKKIFYGLFSISVSNSVQSDNLIIDSYVLHSQSNLVVSVITNKKSARNSIIMIVLLISSFP